MARLNTHDQGLLNSLAKAEAARMGFTLIEVLMAVFILGVGVIGIAALFPVGIAHQQRAVDANIGPIVAANALDIIRSKLRPEYFGTYEGFGTSWDCDPTLSIWVPDDAAWVDVQAPRYTIEGDWTWMRPGVILRDDPSTPNRDERGMLDIFSALEASGSSVPSAWEWAPGSYGGTNILLLGIPYNTEAQIAGRPCPQNQLAPPAIGITQQERYYPQLSQYATSDDPVRPQYYWDCMFRRFQGRILVAIFVYRVSIPGTGGVVGYVPPDSNVPPLPVWLNLGVDPATGQSPPDYNFEGFWDSFGLTPDTPPTTFTHEDDAQIRGTAPNVQYDPADARQAWQEPGQWIIDQNNNVLRVLSRTRESINNPVIVELTRPVPALPTLLPSSTAFPNGDPGVYYYDDTTPLIGTENIVTDIWYMPVSMQIDLDGDGTAETEVTIKPVYATVREL